jgi:hypothetical protein
MCDNLSIKLSFVLIVCVFSYKEVQLYVHDGLACPMHALSNLNPCLWLVMEEKSRLYFKGRWLLSLNDATGGCHT